MKCPYCRFEGTEEEVRDHIVYMTVVVKDKEHSPESYRASTIPAYELWTGKRE